MPTNLVTNGGFEEGTTGWAGDWYELGDFTFWIILSGVGANNGNRYAFGTTNTGGDPGTFITITSDAFNVVPKLTYGVSFYYWGALDTNLPPLYVEIDPGTGSWDISHTYQEVLDGYVRRRFKFLALGTSAKIRFRMPGYHEVTRNWFLDDVEVTLATSEIKAAILTDLQTIDGTGDFNTTIATVSGEPKEVDRIAKPAAFVVSGEWSDDLASITRCKGESTQTYTLLLCVHSTAPNTDLDYFMDDVRNAIGSPTSSTSTASGTDWEVENVDFSGSDTYAVENTSEGTLFADVNVIVRYQFNRGGL